MTVQTTSVAVSWSPSTETGGRSDLYYKVEYSDPDVLGTFITRYTLSTSYTITGLEPHTSYCIRVSAHNGVSDQDPDRSQRRMVEECIRTLEDSKYVSKESVVQSGHAHLICIAVFSMQFQYSLSLLLLAPNAPTEVQGNYPYVVWNAPDQPNGIITAYRLTFTRSGTSTQHTVTTDNDQTFYVIQSGDLPWSSGSITIKVLFCYIIMLLQHLPHV